MNWTKEQLNEALRLQREKVEGKKTEKKKPLFSFSQETVDSYNKNNPFDSSKNRPKDKK